jgi:hypothetical protein
VRRFLRLVLKTCYPLIIRSSSGDTLTPNTLLLQKNYKNYKSFVVSQSKNIFCYFLKCPSFYSFSEEEKEEECEQLSLSESVTRSSSGNTSSELASVMLATCKQHLVGLG